jgi:hypothetical protein
VDTLAGAIAEVRRAGYANAVATPEEALVAVTGVRGRA